MRLALADIKKTISRRGGVTQITPYLLRPGEQAGEIAALIALYELVTEGTTEERVADRRRTRV
jgi:hypothetical protein